MPLASLSDSRAPLPSNGDLLAAARNELKVADAACERLVKTQHLTHALVTRMVALTTVTPEQLPEHLTKHLASAQHSPSPEIALAIRDSVLNNIRQALEKAIPSIAPDAQEILEFLRGGSKRSLDVGPTRAERAISKGAALCMVAQECSTTTCTIDDYTKVATALDEFVKVARQCFGQIGTAGLKSLATQFVAELEAHDQSLQAERRAAQALQLPPHNSQLYRNIVLAVDLHELEKNGISLGGRSTAALHILPSDTLGGASDSLNSLYRQLPAAYTIEINELSAALTSIVGDSGLATEIARNFHAKSTWYQGEYPLVQRILGVSPEQMDLLLNSWSFPQLRIFANSCAALQIGIKVASAALLKDSSLLTSPDETLGLLGKISEYVTQLSPLEHYLPRISPRISPEDFLQQRGVDVASNWLATVRTSGIPPLALSRLAAQNAVTQLLTPHLANARHAATVLVYGFGGRVESKSSGPLVAELTSPVHARNADLEYFELQESASTRPLGNTGLWLDKGHTEACRELTNKGLLRTPNVSTSGGAKKSATEALSTMGQLVRDQKHLPSVVWEHVLAILTGLKSEKNTLSSLLLQTDEIITSSASSSSSPERRRGSSGKQKRMTASPDEISELISAIQQQLAELDVDLPQHQLKRKFDQLVTNFQKLKNAVLPKSSSSDLNQLIEGLELPTRLGRADTSSVLAELVAIQNALSRPRGATKI